MKIVWDVRPLTQKLRHTIKNPLSRSKTNNLTSSCYRFDYLRRSSDLDKSNWWILQDIAENLIDTIHRLNSVIMKTDFLTTAIKDTYVSHWLRKKLLKSSSDQSSTFRAGDYRDSVVKQMHLTTMSWTLTSMRVWWCTRNWILIQSSLIQSSFRSLIVEMDTSSNSDPKYWLLRGSDVSHVFMTVIRDRLLWFSFHWSAHTLRTWELWEYEYNLIQTIYVSDTNSHAQYFSVLTLRLQFPTSAVSLWFKNALKSHFIKSSDDDFPYLSATIISTSPIRLFESLRDFPSLISISMT